MAGDESLTIVRANKQHYHQNNVYWRQLGLKRYPTTEFYLLNCALDLCLDVTLYGVWPFSTYLDGRNIPAHYYESKTPSETHDRQWELRLLLAMHQLGIMKLHIKDCS